MKENILENVAEANTELPPAQPKKRFLRFRKELSLHSMLIVPAILVLIFSYGPMLGLLIAFQDYLPGQGWFVFGSDFIGWENFRQMFADGEIWGVIRNTVVIALAKIVTGTAFPILVAILLNEVGKIWFKRAVQTFIFLPYFISWVIMAGVLTEMLALDGGMLTVLVESIGLKMPDFFGDPAAFPWMLIFSNLWKDAGYGAVIFLAAVTVIDPSLYEAAKIDGAGHMKRCWHVTLPGILPVIILMTVLNMGNILNAGFEQVYNLYNDIVYSTGDILDTYIYRMAFGDAMNYGVSTAASLLKSVVSLLFISAAYFFAYKKFNYQIF